MTHLKIEKGRTYKFNVSVMCRVLFTCQLESLIRTVIRLFVIYLLYMYVFLLGFHNNKNTMNTKLLLEK